MFRGSGTLAGDARCDQIHFEIEEHHIAVSQMLAQFVPSPQFRITLFDVNCAY
jgi:hypothetical protein